MDSLWLGVGAGALGGLATSVVAHSMLQLPLVSVRMRDEVLGTRDNLRLETSVVIANLRGRPVEIEKVMLLMWRRPNYMNRNWNKDLPARLEEGQAIRLRVVRSELPRKSAVPVALDKVWRVWPRRRRLRVRLRGAFGPLGFTSNRRGPSKRRMRRVAQKVPPPHPPPPA